MPEPGEEHESFWSELRRRKVVRVAVVYLAVAFIVIQVADLLVPALLLPDWVYRAIVLVGLLGFPVALVLAWAFELTPDGMRRSAAAPRGRTRRFASLGLGVVVVAGAAAWLMVGATDERIPTDENAVHPGAAIPVVAVLPFDNLSGDEGMEYFSDGITDDIITQLSRIASLRVISRQSVMHYKNVDRSMRDIAGELDATYVMEGSARREEDHIRVNAQLVDAQEDAHLWGETYDRELSAQAIFDIQSDIALRVAEALRAQLTEAERGRIAGTPTRDVTAYDYYLRGKDYAQQGTREGLERSIAFFQQAIRQDSNYARAYAALAFAYSALVGATGAPPSWLDSAEVAARRALELDPTSAESHGALGLVQFSYGRMAEAVVDYERALELAPNDPQALWGLAFVRWHLGELDAALALARRSVAVDPATSFAYPLLGRCYMSLGRDEEAEHAFRRALQYQPDDPWAHDDLITMYIARDELEAADRQLSTFEALRPQDPVALLDRGVLEMRHGAYREARKQFEILARVDPDRDSLTVPEAGFVYDRLGQHELAIQTWERGRTMASVNNPGRLFWAPLDLGRIAAARGEPELAIRHLQTAYDWGWRGFPWLDIARDELLEGLRSDPRFESLRNRILADVERMRARSATSAPEFPG